MIERMCRVQIEAQSQGDQPNVLRVLSFLLIAILVVSGLLSSLTVGLLPPGGGPDELDHYSYVQHLAREPLPLPPRFEEIHTGHASEPNHLVHAPAYHYTMAIAYRILRVDEQLTSAGREADAHGSLTARTVVPPLRMASLIFVLVHLAGLYYLLRYLVQARLIPPWSSIALAAASAWVPSVVFISGTLNNDVLVRAVWPWLVLLVLRFGYERRGEYLSGAILLTGVGILTKATFWPFAVAVIGVSAATLWRGGARDLLTTWRDSKQRRVLRWWSQSLAGLAVALSGLVGWYLVSMVLRYGSPQPSYTSVFGIPTTESKFYRESVATQDDPSFTTVAAALRSGVEDMVGSFIGILGQRERILPPDAGAETATLVALAVASLGLVIWGLLPSRRCARSWVGAALISTAALFAVTYLTRSWRTYVELGNFGSQGRYLIGYIDVWLIGSVILAYHLVLTRASGRARRAIAVILSALLLVVVSLLARPMYYFMNTLEVHNQSGVSGVVEEEAALAGLSVLELEPMPSSSATRIPSGRGGRILPPNAWSLSEPEDGIAAPLSSAHLDGSCLRLVVHIRSSSETRLAVGSGGVDLDRLDGGNPAAILAVPSGVEVLETIIGKPAEVPPVTLWMRPHPGGSDIDILQAFAGPAACP